MIAQLPMLLEILEIERRSQIEDPDNVPGIERLWLARMHYNHQRMTKSMREFFKKLDEGLFDEKV